MIDAQYQWASVLILLNSGERVSLAVPTRHLNVLFVPCVSFHNDEHHTSNVPFSSQSSCSLLAPTMSTDHEGAPLIETSPPPAVSNLRSRFEQLAVQSNPAPPNKSPVIRHSLLPPSPRPRPADLSDTESPSTSLRATPSISDLQATLKLAPLRPVDGPSAPSSPLLRPTVPPPSPPTSDATKTALLSRKPPPPPPPHTRPTIAPTAARSE